MQIGPFELRQHQLRMIEDSRESLGRLIGAGKPPRVLVCAPCGSGKTIYSSAIMSAMKPGSKAAFITSGRQLIFQKSNKLAECELRHSVLMASVYDELDGYYGRPYMEIDPDEFHDRIVCSKDTLSARDRSLEEFGVSLIIVDEAHLAMSPQWKEILDIGVPVIGMTATPATGKGKGLGDFYQDIVIGATYSELIEGGFLTPARVIIPYTVELKRRNGDKVKVSSNGEYVQSQLEEVYNNSELVGDAVKIWKEHSDNRPTLVYASSVKHAIALKEAFLRDGIPAEHVEADTPQSERSEIYRKFQNGDVKVVTNMMVLTTGVDFPCAEVVQLATSMNSVTRFLQTAGRGLRPYSKDGYKKEFCKIIDHGGNVIKHGWPTEDRIWPLDAGEKVKRVDKATNAPTEDAPKVSVCPKCKYEKGGKKKCPNCGYEYVRSGVMVRTYDGKFMEITPDKVKKKKQSSDVQKMWCVCLGIAAARNLPVSAAMAIFRSKMGRGVPSTVNPQPASHQLGMRVRDVWPGFYRRKSRA